MGQPKQKLKLPWKARITVTLTSIAANISLRADGSINRLYLIPLDIRASPNPKPVDSVSSSDIVVDSSRDLWFRLFTPHVSGNCIPVIFFFHGGGFVFLSAHATTYDKVCRRLAKTLPAYVISVNYRLAPEHRYPAQYDDGLDVLKFLDKNHRNVLPANADLSTCFLAGDSAGANIAHHVAIRAYRARCCNVVKLIGLISIQPFFGGEERTESEKRLVGVKNVSYHQTDRCWKAFLPKGSNRNHEAANSNAIDIKHVDYPETLVVVSGFDPLQDWQIRYYKWLKSSRKRVTLVEYPNMIHAFYVFPELEESGQLIQQIKDFIAKRVASVSTR